VQQTLEELRQKPLPTQPTLEEVRQRYELAEYTPAPNCTRCKGKGEIWQEAGEIFEAGYVPCMCIFTHPDDLEMVSEAFNEVIGKLRRELDTERT